MSAQIGVGRPERLLDERRPALTSASVTSHPNTNPPTWAKTTCRPILRSDATLTCAAGRAGTRSGVCRCAGPLPDVLGQAAVGDPGRPSAARAAITPVD